MLNTENGTVFDFCFFRSRLCLVDFALRCRNEEGEKDTRCRRTKVIVLRKMIYLTFLFGLRRHTEKQQPHRAHTFRFCDRHFQFFFSFRM